MSALKIFAAAGVVQWNPQVARDRARATYIRFVDDRRPRSVIAGHPGMIGLVASTILY